MVTIVAAIEHCTAECLGIHAAHLFEAMEPIRQAVLQRFGSIFACAAGGGPLGNDHGSVNMSRSTRTNYAAEYPKIADNPIDSSITRVMIHTCYDWEVVVAHEQSSIRFFARRDVEPG